MSSGITAFIIMLANGTGQIALIAILLGTLQRRALPVVVRHLLSMVLITGFTLVAMHQPVRVVPGAAIDLRGVIVGVAAAFAGWPSAVAAMLAAIVYRVSQGGYFIAGSLSILTAGGMGLLWRYRTRRERATRTRHLLVLGAMIALHGTAALVILPQAPQVSLASVATLALASFLGAFALGKFVEREYHLIATEALLSREATEDPLTGLLNRRGLERGFLEMRAIDRNEPMALLLLDLDHFKRVNDQHGHEVGDRVLAAIGTVLRESLRPLDRAARYGGEEFAIILPRTSRLAAQRHADALCERIRARKLKMPDGQPPLGVTVSIGLAPCVDGLSSLADLLRRADQALYHAKATGRDRVECYRSDTCEDAPAGATSAEGGDTVRLRLASSR